MAWKRTALSILLLTGCNVERGDPAIPSSEEITAVEAALAANACVGSLDQWERHYRFLTRAVAFGPEKRRTNFGVLEFQLRRAGIVSAAPGAVVHAADPPHPFPGAAQGQPALSGTYVIGSGKLTVNGCAG